MAQIQALLMISEEPLNTDQMMERLAISRGNAHGGIKDLVNWGLAQKVHLKGERKDFYQTVKDPWRIFTIVARERHRREIQPLLEILRQCQTRAEGMEGDEAALFFRQIKSLTDFTALAESAMRRVAAAERSFIVKWLLRLVKGKTP
jgi:DNA-binding transcriptional regulator GbsR (MarR family)